jgi:hypothetical protein
MLLSPIALFGLGPSELVVCLIVLVPPVVISYFAAIKNRSWLAWGVPSIVPLVALPMGIALFLASYLCPRCKQSLTKRERLAKACPRCGQL